MTNEQFEQFIKGAFRDALGREFNDKERNHLTGNILSVSKVPSRVDEERTTRYMKENPVKFRKEYKRIMEEENPDYTKLLIRK